MKKVKYHIKYKTGEVIQITDRRSDKERISDIRDRFERYLLTKRQGHFTFVFNDSPDNDTVEEHANNVVLTIDFKDLCSIIEYSIKE
ncbi:MAG: hypothetical protein HGB06_07570 [Chlorobaculum sp.]|jgi:hypothetical protein|nr:hypothetical protein [Chlorobaculum sp.]